MAGDSSFGGAGGGAEAVSVAGGAAGSLMAGAASFVTDAFAGNSGLTGVLPIFGAGFSRLADSTASGFALALAGSAAAAEPEATAASVAGVVFSGWGAAFLVAGWASVLALGVVGMIDAILSFSTSTNPKSVLTLNMLSSKATITP